MRNKNLIDYEDDLGNLNLCRFVETIESLKTRADSGDAEAMFKLSRQVINNDLTARILEIHHTLSYAHELNQKSAELGYPPAMAYEGWFHICGWKSSSSLETAFRYLKSAADSGCFKAYEPLYECYYYGWGIERNFEKAKECLVLVTKFSKIKKRLPKLTKRQFDKADGMKVLEGLREFYN